MDSSANRGGLELVFYDVAPCTRYVVVVGEADLASAENLQRGLKRLLSASWVAHLMLDLSGLGHLDCSALAALLAVREAAEERGQRVSVTTAVGVAAQVLAVTGVGEVFGYPPPA